MLDNYQQNQPVVYKILLNAVKNNRFSHSYLFETNGCDNSLDIALSFSKTLFCKQNKTNNDNCGICTQCSNIDNNSFPELKIIQPDGLWIKKEQLDDLQQNFSKKAVTADKKIYIINNAEKMNESSANSILKFLEEPEDNIIAILITDNVYQLLDTIVSRCQIIKLKSEEVDSKSNLLEKIGSHIYNCNDDIEEFVEKNDAIFVEKSITFINYFEKKQLDILLYTNKYWHDTFKDKENIAIGIEIMLLYYKDVLKYMLNGQVDMFEEYVDDIKEIANKNNLTTISNKIKAIIKNKENIRFNANNNLLMDKIIIEMSGGTKNV